MQSTASAETHLGRCYCGKIRYEVRGTVTNLCLCHCQSCRRSAGATPVAWGTVPRSSYKLLAGDLREYNSSSNVKRGFCARCGTSLTYSHAARGDEIDFLLSTLDAPERLTPQSHVWLQEKMPWACVEDGLARYQAGFNDQ